MTCDPEHKFELALQLGDLKTCYQIAKEAEVNELGEEGDGWAVAVLNMGTALSLDYSKS